jgi:hypothetical protein
MMTIIGDFLGCTRRSPRSGLRSGCSGGMSRDWCSLARIMHEERLRGDDSSRRAA